MKRDPLEEIRRHLDKTDDPILVILRAHLLRDLRVPDTFGEITD